MIVAFLNQKGGVGKSTLAAHFATWEAEQGRSVFVVDADAQGSVTAWLHKGRGAKESPSIKLAAHSDADDLIAVAREESRRFDVVVIDGPGGVKNLSRGACLVADVVVVPMGPSAMDVDSTRETIRILRNCQLARGQDLPAPLLVLNKVRNPRYRLSREATALKGQLGAPACATVLGERDAFVDAMGQGTVVWRLGPRARAAAVQCLQLVQEIDAYATKKAPRRDACTNREYPGRARVLAG